MISVIAIVLLTILGLNMVSAMILALMGDEVNTEHYAYIILTVSAVVVLVGLIAVGAVELYIYTEGI